MKKYTKSWDISCTQSSLKEKGSADKTKEDEERWEKIIDFTKIKKGGVSIDEILKRLKCLK